MGVPDPSYLDEIDFDQIGERVMVYLDNEGGNPIIDNINELEANTLKY